jgi:uncharacterized protein (TIGR04255 family)
VLTIEPVAGRHAIKTVSFGVEWEVPLTPDQIAEFLQLYQSDPNLKEQLPRKVEQRAVPAAPPGARLAQLPLSGVMFDSLKPNGEQKWALLVQPQFLSVTCGEYDKWDETWPRARELLRISLPKALEYVPANAAGLQYLNAFLVKGNVREFRAESVLRKGSVLLPPNVFKRTDLWHSNHGFFDEEVPPQQGRTLRTFNVDLVEHTPDQCTLQIVSAHTATLPQPTNDAAALVGRLNELLDGLHIQHKETLGQLLNDDMCQKIGLFTEPVP